jgi:hypothetical protein
VRVMLALHGFIRRSFNDFGRSPLVTPEYIWGYSHTPMHPSSCRTNRILGDTYGQDYITVLTEFADAHEGASPLLPRPKIICQGIITSRYISRMGRMRGTIGCFVFSPNFFSMCQARGCSGPLWTLWRGNDMYQCCEIFWGPR